MFDKQFEKQILDTKTIRGCEFLVESVSTSSEALGIATSILIEKEYLDEKLFMEIVKHPNVTTETIDVIAGIKNWIYVDDEIALSGKSSPMALLKVCSHKLTSEYFQDLIFDAIKKREK